MQFMILSPEGSTNFPLYMSGAHEICKLAVYLHGYTQGTCILKCVQLQLECSLKSSASFGAGPWYRSRASVPAMAAEDANCVF